jgi:signal transduction histidine kinase
MEDLIQDLLELSRIGRTQTEPGEVDLDVLVRDIADAIHSSNPDATIDGDHLPTLLINPVRARQLFTNIIENAVHHSGRQDVTVSVRSSQQSDGSIQIGIKDNGEGIPGDYRERVFRVFERLQPEEGTGTGIGLSICRKIVDGLRGRIWVEDTKEGTDVEIALPADAVRARKVEVGV